MYVFSCIHTMHICICKYVCMYTYIHTHTNKHTHTHTHTNNHFPAPCASSKKNVRQNMWPINTQSIRRPHPQYVEAATAWGGGVERRKRRRRRGGKGSRGRMLEGFRDKEGSRPSQTMSNISSESTSITPPDGFGSVGQYVCPNSLKIRSMKIWKV